MNAARTLAVIVLLGAVLRLVPIWFALEYPQARPDESVALRRAAAALEGQLNPGFFHWPSLTFYVFAGVLGLVSAVRGVTLGDAALTYAEQVVAARALVALAGTMTIVVLYRLTERMADAATGLLAAAFLAVALLHVRESHFAMTDVLMTLLVLASLALLGRGVDAARDGLSSARWFAVAGLAAGLATGTKYNAGALVAAALAAQIVVRRARGTAHEGVRPLAAFAVLLALGFVVSTPYSILDFRTFATDLHFNFTHLSGGHGINVGRGWTYHLTHSLPYGTGLPIFVVAVAGLVPFARRHGTHAAVIGAFAGAYYAAIGSGYTVFFRYILPLVPLACLSAAVLVREAGPWLARRLNLAPSATTALLAGLLAAPGLVHAVWFDLLLARTDTRVIATEWLDARIRPGESVHDTGGDFAQLDLRAQYHRWHFDPDAGSFGDPEGRTPDWLVLHQSPLRQYATVPPGLRRLATERYDLVWEVRATRGPAGRAVYDLHDAFFLPLSRFDTVVRPGTTIRIYRKRPG
jgi:hypothetical protein